MRCFQPLFVASLSLAAVAAAQSNVTVHDTHGNITYVGATVNQIESFQGIKYGQDTSGANRFKAPRPFNYSTGTTVQATAAGPSCPQNTVEAFLGAISENPGIFNLSEDCLNLRIARPPGTQQNASLPVMVWIFGEGDESGSSNSSVYDPTLLVLGAASKGTPVIFVSMNYRLNVFGFANSPALRAEHSLNAGLLDQRLGLEWIQNHIAAFGGNPKNVTLFGESDGATSIGLQLTAYGGTRGPAPFQHAIMQSGGPAADPGVAGNLTINSTTSVAELAGCNQTNSSAVLSCLRGLQTSQLLNAVLQFENASAADGASAFQDIFFPVVDGNFTPAAPSTLMRTGKFYKNVSVITGWNYNDGSIFAPPTLNSSDGVQAYLGEAYPTLNSTTIQTLLSLYPVETFAAAAQNLTISPFFLQAAEIYRDVNFACQSLDTAHQVARYGSHSYVYVLNTTSLTAVLQLANATFEGVLHFSDVPLVFNHPDLVGFGVTPEQNLTAARMSGSWARFASTGMPGGPVTNASNSAAVANSSFVGWVPAFANLPANATSLNITTASVRVIGGPQAGQSQLRYNDTAGGVEPSLLHRCAYINTSNFSQQLQT